MHRWYESRTGRYTRVDPLGVTAGPTSEPPVHLFVYVDNRPLCLRSFL